VNQNLKRRLRLQIIRSQSLLAADIVSEPRFVTRAQSMVKVHVVETLNFRMQSAHFREYGFLYRHYRHGSRPALQDSPDRNLRGHDGWISSARGGWRNIEHLAPIRTVATSFPYPNLPAEGAGDQRGDDDQGDDEHGDDGRLFEFGARGEIEHQQR